MSVKTFTVVGTSCKKGETKLRFANGSASARAKVLEKDNHTEIKLYDLPHDMTAEEATEWLKNNSDAVPVDLSAPVVKQPKPTVVAIPRTRNKEDTVKPATIYSYTADEIAEGTKLLAADKLMRFMRWDQLSDECQAWYISKVRAGERAELPVAA